ncbi:MAG: transcriptional repressor [Saprospiraceae bacterium]|nr:transcriptional repressor [Saprospiraceae bacterium]MBK8670664.1 transcriptional repressor [Saprospiraceae bacterium]
MIQAETILKKHRLRVTQFRVDVVEIFASAGRALSSPDIEEKLKDADRITLYRTLKSFEDKGIIHKAIDGTIVQKYALCEAHCDEHHHHDEHVHFHCESCENTFCLERVFVPKVDLPAGFSVTQTNMIVHGICEKCK